MFGNWAAQLRQTERCYRHAEKQPGQRLEYQLRLGHQADFLAVGVSDFGLPYR